MVIQVVGCYDRPRAKPGAMNRLARPSKILGIQARPRILLPHRSLHARGLIIPSLSSAFLQLGEAFSALPLPEAIPPYSAAIIFTTILLRSCTTLPLAIWVRCSTSWVLFEILTFSSPNTRCVGSGKDYRMTLKRDK